MFYLFSCCEEQTALSLIMSKKQRFPIPTQSKIHTSNTTVKSDFLEPVFMQEKKFLCLRNQCGHVLKCSASNNWMNIWKINS